MHGGDIWKGCLQAAWMGRNALGRRSLFDGLVVYRVRVYIYSEQRIAYKIQNTQFQFQFIFYILYIYIFFLNF